MVIWITGLSGAGKTTLIQAIAGEVKRDLRELVLLDGDAIRQLFGNDLDYREASRVIQIKRIQGMAKFLSDQGLVVMVAALYAHPDLLRWNRDNFAGYFEVYIQASMGLVGARDSKGLYVRARRNETENVVGIDIPWHPPTDADLVLDADSGESVDVMAKRVIAAIPRLRVGSAEA
jgi:adenylylsulfate kinase-like enzyme